jgi:putative transcriptional regulator
MKRNMRKKTSQRHDWRRYDSMTDAEVHKAALSDPDAQPLSEKRLRRMRRVPLAKHARWIAGLSQSEFAEHFHIPLGELRDWERGSAEPDETVKAYLEVIASDPEGAWRALRRRDSTVPGPRRSNVINLMDALRRDLIGRDRKQGRNRAKPTERGQPKKSRQ